MICIYKLLNMNSKIFCKAWTITLKQWNFCRSNLVPPSKTKLRKNKQTKPSKQKG